MSDFQEIVASGKATMEPLGIGKFGAKLVTFGDGTKGILKFKSFANDTFRGVEKERLPLHEVAVYRLDKKILKFGVVPETLLIKLNGQEASIQKYEVGFEARDLQPGIFDKRLPNWKYSVAQLFSKLNTDDLHKIIVMDLIINNTDRHARNVIIDTANNRVWAIDNGLSFGNYFHRYRNVFHKYMFLKRFHLPGWMMRLLSSISAKQLEDCLGEYLSDREIRQTKLRIKFILDHKGKLDFLTLSQGEFDKNSFPSYKKWFHRQMRPNPEIPHILDLTQFPGWNPKAKQSKP